MPWCCFRPKNLNMGEDYYKCFCLSEKAQRSAKLEILLAKVLCFLCCGTDLGKARSQNHRSSKRRVFGTLPSVLIRTLLRA